MSEVIDITGPIYASISPNLAAVIKPYLTYPYAYYKEGPFHKKRIEGKGNCLLTGNRIYLGFLEKVKKICEEKKIDLQIKGFTDQKLPVVSEPHLKGIDFNSDILGQTELRLIKAALEKQRGVLKAPTGIGKTIMGLAFLSAFPKEVKILWLCDKKTLMRQTAEEAIKLGFKNVGMLGDQEMDLDADFLVATRQSCISHLQKLKCVFDIIVVDETHHISSFKGDYHTILTTLLAEVRIGLTATLSPDKQSQLALEGLIGPIMEQITIQEGIEKGLISKPKIKLLKIPRDYNLAKMKGNYEDIYIAGIVHRAARHKAILDVAKKHLALGDSILILVSRVEHGDILQAIFIRNDIDALFVCGNTDSDTRKEVIDALKSKEWPCVIATTVFKEGINIPSLNVVINAAGGKSEIATLQGIGRGMRRCGDKWELTVYDIWDPSHRFFIAHFAERFSLYAEEDWI